MRNRRLEIYSSSEDDGHLRYSENHRYHPRLQHNSNRSRMSLVINSPSSYSSDATCTSDSMVQSMVESDVPSHRLKDNIVYSILKLIKDSADLKACSLVCKRWMRIEGSLRSTITVNDFDFVESGRLTERFPNLTHIDLSPAWTVSSSFKKGSGVTMSRNSMSMRLGTGAMSPFSLERLINEQKPSSDSFDRGLTKLVKAYPNLLSLSVVDVLRMSAIGFKDTPPQKVDPVSGAPVLVGLEIVAHGMPHIQELEVRQCTDFTLAAISAMKNVQVVRLVGMYSGFYHGTFTDMGLQHFAMNCRRMFSLSLSGCEVGFNGLMAVAKYCPMLTELTLGGREVQAGWMKALQYFASLQVLRLEGMKHVDKDPYCCGALGKCLGLYCLEVKNCDVRPHAGFQALLDVVSHGLKELVLQNCWGLEDEVFQKVTACRFLKSLALEGCSLVTTAGLEAVVVSAKDMQRLSVTFCSNIKDNELSEVLSNKMFALKELKWQPDNQTFMVNTLKEAGVGEKGRWLLGAGHHSVMSSMEM